MAVNTNYNHPKTIVGGVYMDPDPTGIAPGDPVALNVDEIGRLKLACTSFSPTVGAGQAIAFSTVAGRSTVLVTGGRYWIWASEGCWIAFGDNTITAASGDFPLPPGAVTEYIPTTDLDYVSAVQINQTGTLYIGRAA